MSAEEHDPLRIAYVCTVYPSVSHTFIQGEIRTLEANGAEVVRVALNAPRSDELLTDADREEAARTYYVKAAGRGRLLVALAMTAVRHPVAFVRGVIDALRAGGPNLALGAKSLLYLFEGMIVWRRCRRAGVTAVHAHFGQAPASVAMACAAFGSRTGPRRWTWSMTIHGWHEFTVEDTARLAAKLAAADGVVAVSSFTRAQLLRISGSTDLARVTVVRCGVDLARFTPRVEPAPGPRVIAITARLSPEKGHVILFEAMARLRRDGFETQARLIGDGPFRPDLEAAAARLGLDDAVAFTGALEPDRVAAELRGAGVFCLPTAAEGLPISLMEAMAVGTPVVTTYISGIPELVIDGVTGWVVPSGDPDALATALRDAFTSPSGPAITTAARQRVEEFHDQVRNVGQLADVLRRSHAS